MRHRGERVKERVRVSVCEGEKEVRDQHRDRGRKEKIPMSKTSEKNAMFNLLRQPKREKREGADTSVGRTSDPFTGGPGGRFKYIYLARFLA